MIHEEEIPNIHSTINITREGAYSDGRRRRDEGQVVPLAVATCAGAPAVGCTGDLFRGGEGRYFVQLD